MGVPRDVLRVLSMDPDVARCPVTAFSALRDEAPVVEVPEAGLFVVTGRREALEVLRDAATFCSGQQANVESARNMAEMLRRAAVIARARGEFPDILDDAGSSHPSVLPHVDAPAHTHQRQAIQPALTVRRARASESMLDEIASALIDDFIGSGEVELRTQYSDPLMLTFILRELRASPDDAQQLLQWVSYFIKVQGSEISDAELDEVAEARVEFDAYFLRLIEEVRAEPSDDILSRIVQAEVDGRSLTPGEVLMICQTLLVGGTETSSSTTSKAMLFLATHPEVAEVLRKEPAAIPSFVEETLRLNGPVQLLFRRATRDVELSGVLIPAGSRVGVHVGAAGRDPEECPMPDTLDLQRQQPHQLMFGFGPHYCSGAELGRVQVRVALRQLLSRMSHFELAVPEESLVFFPQVNLHRLAALPLRFTSA